MTDLIKDVLGDPVFMVCALVSLGGALTVVVRRNPVYSALGLMSAFLAFAVIFIKLNATFLAAMHVLVYTGAILVLFLFVIMLLNLSERELGTEHGLVTKGAIGAGAALLCALLVFVMLQEPSLAVPVERIRAQTLNELTPQAMAIDQGNWGGVEHVGNALFTYWVFPFELVSLLIVVAILGAVVLAKKKLPPEL